MDDDFDGTRPAWFDAVLADVDRAFAVTGADTPGWPDPHPDRSPREEEYSRVSDVDKYRILDSRVEAWTQVLAASGVAGAVDVPAGHWIAECRPPELHLCGSKPPPGEHQATAAHGRCRAPDRDNADDSTARRDVRAGKRAE